MQAKLIAFLDDASRVCCHGEFFIADNTEALLGAFKSALYKRGLCECLYVDHGSNYSSMELSKSASASVAFCAKAAIRC